MGNSNYWEFSPAQAEVPAPEGATLVGTQPTSDDGEYALFETGGFLTGTPESQLYLREQGSRTVIVSLSQRTVEPDPNPLPLPKPVAVSGDGATVLFISKSELTNDANTGSSNGVASDKGADLYSYDVATGVLSDLAPDSNPADEATGANVGRVFGFTHDMSYIYFGATGVLAPGAVSGEENVYVLHEGTIRFIASEAGGLYITPDGRHVALTSSISLTGYDNTNPTTGTPEAEAFEYTYGEGLGVPRAGQVVLPLPALRSSLMGPSAMPGTAQHGRSAATAVGCSSRAPTRSSRKPPTDCGTCTSTRMGKFT